MKPHIIKVLLIHKHSSILLLLLAINLVRFVSTSEATQVYIAASFSTIQSMTQV